MRIHADAVLNKGVTARPDACVTIYAHCATKRMRDISTDEFSYFLDENNVTSTCPSCGFEESAVSVAPENAQNVALTRWDHAVIDQDAKKIGSVPSRSIVAASLICQRCGYMRFFAAIRVLQWLHDRALAQGQRP